MFFYLVRRQMQPESPRHQSNQQGFALIMGLLIVAVISLYSTTGTMVAKTSLDLSAWDLMIRTADLLAEAGLDREFCPSQLQSDVATLTALLSNSNPNDDDIYYSDGGLKFTTDFTYDMKLANGSNLWTITARSPLIGAGPNRRILTAKVITRTISDFALLTADEGPPSSPVEWGAGDTVNGNMHTNDRFHLNGNPVFSGGTFSSVHSSVGSPYDCNGACNPTITSTAVYGDVPKTIPSVGLVETWITGRSVTVLSGATTVTTSYNAIFKRTNVHVTNAGLSGGSADVLLPSDTSGTPSDPYGLFITTENGDVTVNAPDGTVDGRVTISALGGDIIIPTNSGSFVPSKCDPRAPSMDADCKDTVTGPVTKNNDRLNLFAKGDIKITSSAATVNVAGVGMFAWGNPTMLGTKGQIRVSQAPGPSGGTFNFLGVMFAEHGFSDSNGLSSRSSTITQDGFFNTENFGTPFIVWSSIGFEGDYRTGP